MNARSPDLEHVMRLSQYNKPISFERVVQDEEESDGADSRAFPTRDRQKKVA